MTRTDRAVLAALMAVLALLAGCDGHVQERGGPPARFVSAAAPLSECAGILARFDESVAAAGVVDGQAATIPGFPYLGASRFLAAMRPDPDERPAFDFWFERLRDLGRTRRGLELANLPRAARDRLPADLAARLERCERRLSDADRSSAHARARLVDAVRVPDEYRTDLRVAGLYPLTALPFRAGVAALHDRLRAGFVEGRPGMSGVEPSRYRPSRRSGLAKSEAARIVERSADNPLSMPRPDAADLERLFAAHAPTWEIAYRGPDDRLATPAKDRTGNLVFADGPAKTYVLPSWTRFEGEPLLQLNYTVWFPARTSTGPLDLLAGKLDGVTWRVTLDRDGQPLAYDSMHNCGCYHLFLPTDRLRPRAPAGLYEEPALVMPTVRAFETGPALRLASGTHYLEAVFEPAAGAAENYELTAYAELRSMPLGGDDGTRLSLFRPDGIVEGSERPERLFFWPMGVPEPGAMRQWGRHATAFVGRRHFDDAGLLDRYFERVGPGTGTR